MNKIPPKTTTFDLVFTNQRDGSFGFLWFNFGDL